ncbi:hypothetical protein EMCG_05338 [[Emmonsia] crescens]|uniref:Uncharacterized protein n=1 Tax=[Emmonsia] crescens TaxID=73230 RepID=A0A0G2HQD3_9EURO|nr:hypothetical protein EMCG_05338 [Emmonsia crescens UAMH 3008]
MFAPTRSSTESVPRQVYTNFARKTHVNSQGEGSLVGFMNACLKRETGKLREDICHESAPAQFGHVLERPEGKLGAVTVPKSRILQCRPILSYIVIPLDISPTF